MNRAKPNGIAAGLRPEIEEAEPSRATIFRRRLAGLTMR
jgi:hypothetical protein